MPANLTRTQLLILSATNFALFLLTILAARLRKGAKVGSWRRLKKPERKSRLPVQPNSGKESLTFVFDHHNSTRTPPFRKLSTLKHLFFTTQHRTIMFHQRITFTCDSGLNNESLSTGVSAFYTSRLPASLIWHIVM